MLKRIEADVVIVINGTEENCFEGEVFPLWECDGSPGSVREKAIQRTLEFVEMKGCSGAIYQIYDFRKIE